MKIGLVTFGVTGKGGTQRQFLSLAQALRARRHEVTVYTFDFRRELSYEEFVRDLKIVALPGGENVWAAGQSGKSSPLSFLFGKLVAKINGKKAVDAASEALAGMIDSGTEVLNFHDADSYKVGYYFKKINPRARAVWTMNDPPISFLPKKTFLEEISRRIFNFFELIYERKFVRSVDRIVVLDGRNKKMAESFYGRPVSIIRSGLDFEKFYHPSRKRDYSKQPMKFLALGIMMPHRRFEDAILAADILRNAGRNFRLTVVSQSSPGNPYGAKIISLADSLNLRDVVDLRLSESGISDKELFDFYRDSDVFIFPNHMQTWGLSVFEAMAAGLPAIVSKTSGASEVLTDGKNALFIDPLSPNQIAAKAQFLMKNPADYKRIAEAGQKFVKENISWEKYADSMLGAFKES
jgi:glycosyltransferase involved in cell wall biosynthesis